MRYASRVRPDQDRRRTKTPARTAEWTPELAYAVGLIATDGCLTRGRTISFPSADRQLVELLLACLKKHNKISKFRTRIGNIAYRTQIGDVALYRWLEGIGITPRKSLTIGAIDVPDAVLLPLARGLLDGDGSIMNKRARADTKRCSDYYWEYLRTKFVSASRTHLEWLRGRIRDVLGIDGYIELARGRDGHHDMYALRYGKRISLVLLPALYEDPVAPRLMRKWAIWAAYCRRHGLDRLIK